MKRFLIGLCVSLYLVAPALALAQTPAPTEAAVASVTVTPLPTSITDGDLEGALDLLPQLLEAITQKNWVLVAALGLLLLVFVVRTYLWKSITKEWIPIATVLTAAASASALALLAGKSPVESGMAGMAVGLSSIGIYELFKAIKRLVTGKPKANG